MLTEAEAASRSPLATSFDSWRQACSSLLLSPLRSPAPPLPPRRSASSSSSAWIRSVAEIPSQAVAAATKETGAAEESDKDRFERRRCEQWKDELFRTSPMVRFMSRHLAIVSCDPTTPARSGSRYGAYSRIEVGSCPEEMAGGFIPSEPGSASSDSIILICSNRILSKQHLEDTLAHEMIHWWDHCRFNVNWEDLRHHACSEIRAASLSGDCNLGREFLRRQYGFTKQHQVCARRRAILSVTSNPNCKDAEMAAHAVDSVWQSCFNDTRPFDEIY